ncbi:MAG: PilN domain-containing protein [Geminicoccaceae bacterium]
MDLATLAPAASRFVSWWRQELADCLPKGRSADVRLKEVRFDGEALEAPGASRSTAHPVRLILVDLPALRLALPSAPLAKKAVRSACDLHLEAHWPLADEPPFWDYRLLDGLIDIAALPASAVEGALARAREAGWVVAAVDLELDGAALGLNLLPDALRPQRKPVLAWPNRWLAAICVLCLAYAAGLQWWRLDQGRDALAASIAEAEGAAREVLAQRQQLERVLADIELLQGAVADRVSISVLIDEIAQALPDGAWLTELRFEEGTITLIGRSSDAAPLIRDLEARPNFAQVRLTSPIVRDSRFDVDRFEIAMRKHVPSDDRP